MKRCVLALAAILAAAPPAPAYIEALQNLNGVIQESDVVARGVVDAVSIEKKVVILRVSRTVKGKSAYERIRIDMSAGETWHPEAALRHAVVGAPVAVFYRKAENSELASLSLVYLNRFFLMIKGEDPVWRFTRIELAMNKAYHGTAEELNELVLKIRSGRSKPPAPQAQLRPWTRETLDALPLSPKEGEKWAPFDAAAVFEPRKTPAPDADGFLQNWLVAGPVPQKAAAEPPKGTPKAGETFADSPWKAHLAPEYFLAAEAAAETVLWAVSYITCDRDVPDLRLAAGADEPSTWWLNGEEAARTPEARALARDQAFSKPLVLKKGLNVLVGAATSKSGPVSACVRFLDKDGKPFRGFSHDPSP